MLISRDACAAASALDGGFLPRRKARRVKLHVKKTPTNEAATAARARERPRSTAASRAGCCTESVNRRSTPEMTERTVCGHHENQPHFQRILRSCATASDSAGAASFSAARNGRARCACEKCAAPLARDEARERHGVLSGRTRPLLASTSASPSAVANVSTATLRMVRMQEMDRLLECNLGRA